MRRLLRQLAESGTAFREVFANPGLRRIQLAWAASIVGTWAYGIAVVARLAVALERRREEDSEDSAFGLLAELEKLL